MARGKRRGFGAIRRLPSGRYQASYTAPDGQRRNAPSTFKAQLDAEAWLVRRREEITDGTWTPQKSDPEPAPTFATFATQWVEKHRRADGRDLAPSTRAHYRRIINNRLVPAFGDRPMNTLTPELVRAWFNSTDAKPTIRAHSYQVLQGICDAAVPQYLATNPCTIRGGGRATRASKTRLPTLGDLATIREAMPERLQAAVNLAAWCGLRFGEIFELRRRDLDMTVGLVKVRRAVTRVDGELLISEPKTDAGIRDVHIPPHLLPELQQHLDTYSQPGARGLVFPTIRGLNYHPATVQRNFAIAREAADREDLRWHDLRHFGATQAARAGATLKELQARIGHSTPEAALRYQHAAQDRDAQIALALSDMATED